MQQERGREGNLGKNGGGNSPTACSTASAHILSPRIQLPPAQVSRGRASRRRPCVLRPAACVCSGACSGRIGLGAGLGQGHHPCLLRRWRCCYRGREEGETEGGRETNGGGGGAREPVESFQPSPFSFLSLLLFFFFLFSLVPAAIAYFLDVWRRLPRLGVA